MEPSTPDRAILSACIEFLKFSAWVRLSWTLELKAKTSGKSRAITMRTVTRMKPSSLERALYGLFRDKSLFMSLCVSHVNGHSYLCRKGPHRTGVPSVRPIRAVEEL